jgi:hypothetical protein
VLPRNAVEDLPATARAAGIPIYGYVYDVHSGCLIEVPEATEEGRARTAAAV